MPMLTSDDIQTYHRVRDIFLDQIGRTTSLQPSQRRDLTTALIERFAKEGITMTLPAERELIDTEGQLP